MSFTVTGQVQTVPSQVEFCLQRGAPQDFILKLSR